MRSTIVIALGLLVACAAPTPGLDASIPDAPDGGCGLASCACPDPGVYPSLSLGGDHTFSLHVPAGHRCDVPSALVIELRGDHDDGESVALDQLAESASFVLARPSTLDLDRALTESIVVALQAIMPIDPARIHVVGSGRGARVAAQWLYEGTLVPRGIALIDYDAPASDIARPVRDFDVRPRLWLSTGERDVGIDAQNALLSALRSEGFDASELGIRERDSGASTPGWLFPELWDWLDRAMWREGGPAAPEWIRQNFPFTDSMLSLEALPDATLLAGSADGRVFGTDSDGKWGLFADLGEGPLVSVLASSGQALLGSTRGLVRSPDGLTFSRDIATTTSVGALIDIADQGGTMLYGVSALGVAISGDRGVTWTMRAPASRLEAIAVSPTTGTVLAVGPGGVARLAGSDSVSSASAAILHDVAAGPDGTWWAVGDAAAVLRSVDDGVSFAPIAPGPLLDDLYSVHIGADGAMIAGGAHGSVLVSHDHLTLTSRPTGGQGYIGEVRWIGPGRAVIVGELGYIAIADGL